MTTQVAVRIPDEDLAAIDAAVARGDYPTRSAAILAALRASGRREREREIAEEYRRAYAEHPEAEPSFGTWRSSRRSRATARRAVATIFDRGGVRDVELPDTDRHQVVIVTREVAIPVRLALTVAIVASTVRGHAAEVPVGRVSRECVVNCDHLHAVDTRLLGRRRGALGPERIRQLDEALRVALGLD